MSFIGLNPHGDNLYYESAAVIITLVQFGKYLEARSKGKTVEAIKKNMGVHTKMARKIEYGEEKEIKEQLLHNGIKCEKIKEYEELT